MFRAEQQNQFIPSKSVAIKPENVAVVSPDDEIRFHIPSFIAFLDPTNSYLKFQIKFKDARGQIVPDARAGGAHSLFRQVIVRDGSNATTLELSEEYGAHKALLNQFTRNARRMDELFNGVQVVDGTEPSNKTLYYKALAAIASTDGNAPDTDVREAHTPMVQMRLDTGLFRSGNVLPVGVMNGLRIQLQTDSLLRSCVLSNLGGAFGRSGILRVRLASGQNKANGTELRRQAEAGLADGGSGEFGYRAQTDIGFEQNPFVVGDILYAATDVAGANEVELGSILGFYRAGVGNAFLGINYNTLRNEGVGLGRQVNDGEEIYYKVEDREKAYSFFTLADRDTNVKSGSYNAPSYEISDLEFICQSVQPPEAYVNGIMSAANSAQGIQFDIMSYQLFRHNQANTTGLVQAQIPTTMTRAKALFCQPLGTASSKARSIGAHSLSGMVDGAQTYEFIHGTQHYPSRLAPLHRYGVGVGATTRVEALHVSELQKALANVDERVLNLQKIKDNFVVARSLSKYGQIMDLSKQTTSVRIDYLNGTQQKILYLYAVGLRRIVVNSQGVMAMF